MKKSKKDLRRQLLEKRFSGLAAERKAKLKVPESLAGNVFQTLEKLEGAVTPEAAAPLVSEKIVALFEKVQE